MAQQEAEISTRTPTPHTPPPSPQRRRHRDCPRRLHHMFTKRLTSSSSRLDVDGRPLGGGENSPCSNVPAAALPPYRECAEPDEEDRMAWAASFLCPVE